VVYFAAILIVAGVALFVAAPLAGGSVWRRRSGAAQEIERIEHARELAMQGLRDLEFDREMGKLADADYAALKAPLEARALAAMEALGRLASANRPGASSPDAAGVVVPLRGGGATRPPRP
jgi:cytochrome c-type biogenesis protein CcmI